MCDSLPTLHDMTERFADEPFAVVGINTDTDAGEVQPAGPEVVRSQEIPDDTLAPALPEDLEAPKDSPQLTAKEIATIKAWINGGAK